MTPVEIDAVVMFSPWAGRMDAFETSYDGPTDTGRIDFRSDGVHRAFEFAVEDIRDRAHVAAICRNLATGG